MCVVLQGVDARGVLAMLRESAQSLQVQAIESCTRAWLARMRKVSVVLPSERASAHAPVIACM